MSSVSIDILAGIDDAILGDILFTRRYSPAKPALITEYGADTVTGLHSDPPVMFTEEYQTEFCTVYHNVFNNVSSILNPDSGFFIGELPWNMYDFATDQTINRIGGLNRKCLFTRQHHLLPRFSNKQLAQKQTSFI